MGLTNDIAIITDTDGDFSREIYEGYPIFTLPLILRQGEQEYKDGINITVEDVYRRQPTEDFKTSLPSMDDVEMILDRIRAEGYKKVMILILSSGLSGAINSMRMLAEDVEDLEIAVLDTKSASVGVGVIALQVARLAKAGMDFETLKVKAAQIIEDTDVFFSIDTLEYLARGGRIGRATEFVGSLLKIKPIMSFAKTDGAIYVPVKVRGTKGVIKALVKLLQDKAAAHPNLAYRIVICNGGVPERAKELEKKLLEVMTKCVEVLHGTLDATLAVHLGPNLLGAGIQFIRE